MIRRHPKMVPDVSRAFHKSHFTLCERAISLADYPAESGSGGALFAETPNELGAEGTSLN
jgi:hypothetical protein